MESYQAMSQQSLQKEYEILTGKYNEFKERGLSLDMSRGKPDTDQLGLSMAMLDVVSSKDTVKSQSGADLRNYGLIDGIPEAKKLFADMLQVEPKNIIIGGNSSLSLMYDSIVRAVTVGIMGSTPWCRLPRVKFLCPVPGYDRHFAICEQFSIEMINIPMNENGPDMDMIESLVEADDSIKGVWCVPMYSNPTGYTFSDEVVRRFSRLKPKAKDFRIYWDNAYCMHHLSDNPDKLLNIFEEAKKAGNEDIVIGFASTSKISFAGSGVAVIAASEANVKDIISKLAIQTIGFDKINQLRHVKYFKDINGIEEHMKKHQAMLAPKFEAVISMLDKELAPLSIASYTRPNGGYFISFNTMEGCAIRVGELCRNAGVVLTNVGATFPYGKDEKNSNIRIAPTFPPVEELKLAMELFCICVKMASIEKLLQK